VAVACALAMTVWSVGQGGDSETARSAAPVRRRPVPPVPQPKERDAVRTAASFLSSMTLDALLNGARRRSIVGLYAEPSARPALEQIYDGEGNRVAASYRHPPRVARAALVGYRVDGFHPPAATVSLWAATIGGSADYPPTTDWFTTVVDLAWTARGWRITGVDQKPGPSSDWPIKSLATEARTFRPFRYAP
jgi:hypothetical protein